MATTSLLTSKSNNENQYNNTNTNTNTNLNHSTDQFLQQAPISIRRSSGRKKGKGNGSEKKIKRDPQRGMGVAKLEHLRHQEKWKQMTAEISSNSTNSAFVNGGDPNMLMISGSSINLLHHPGQKNLGHFGHPSYNNNMGYHHHHHGVLIKSSHHVTDEISTNDPTFVPHCNSCHKKKKVSGENLYNNQIMGPTPTGDNQSGFLKLSIGSENQIYKPKPQMGYAARTISQYPAGHVGLVAVHRKEKGSNSVVMEYEFFPNGSCSSKRREDDAAAAAADDDDLVMMKAVGPTTNTSTTAEPFLAAAFDGSTSIDLSLKLSSY